MSPKSYEELLIENEMMREILDHIHEGVYVIDEKETIILFNNEMEKIEGLKKENVLDKKENDVYGVLQTPLYNTVVTQPIRKHGKALLDQVYTYNFPDGRVTNQIFNAYPFYYDKKLKAIYSIGRNMNQIGGFIAGTFELNNIINRNKKAANKATFFLGDIVGKSKSIREAVKLSRRVAANSSPVLIYGKTGTGKELFAQGIHNASMFADGPFVPVNCAAIPETLLEATLFGTKKGAFTGAVDMPGLFEQAQNGSIFLDELNSMPQQLQAKMLRVLQDKTVRRLGGKDDIAINCRIISACNQDPFIGNDIREDFLYRISTAVINIEPLKDRRDDIIVLANHFIKNNNLRFGLFVEGLSPQLLKIFESYSWPGNVRELENVIETSMNVMDMHTIRIGVNDLPSYICSRMNIERIIPEAEQSDLFEEAIDIGDEADNGDYALRKKLLSYEKKLIENALWKYNGNITKAARELGMHRQNLHYRINRFNLKDFIADDKSHI